MKSVEDGTWEVDTPFWGMEKGCVDLSPWGPNVPTEVVNIVESEKKKFVLEKYDASFPFSAGFTKQDGTVVPAGMGRSGIESMDFFVDGVISPMP